MTHKKEESCKHLESGGRLGGVEALAAAAGRGGWGRRAGAGPLRGPGLGVVASRRMKGWLPERIGGRELRWDDALMLA